MIVLYMYVYEKVIIERERGGRLATLKAVWFSVLFNNWKDTEICFLSSTTHNKLEKKKIQFTAIEEVNDTGEQFTAIDLKFSFPNLRKWPIV